MKFLKIYLCNLFALSLLLLSGCKEKAPVDTITIDVADEKAEIPSSLYGVFFEEITNSGDGGLYAEMILNRGFEDGNAPSGTTIKGGRAIAASLPCYSNEKMNNFTIEWDDNLAMKGWSVENTQNGQAFHKIVSENPLNSATPHSICIDAGKSNAPVALVNSGYWGIAVEKGKNYNLRFYVRADNSAGDKVDAAIVDKTGKKTALKSFDLVKDNKWNEYTGTLTAEETGNDFRFMLIFPNKGKVYVDFVSLFPEETFSGHKNGLRKDVAEMLQDLQPAFVRWPGGCIVEGLTMENRVKWKETIGDIVTRPGEYNLWGYRSTYGFGYHEFLQFCEDISADGMFVCNAGMSCLFRNGDYYSKPEQIDELITEALDAIEYAIGDTTTKWGKERAKNGHPAPFPLRYVEVGNENIGLKYVANYNRFYKAIKEKYPQIEIICALMFHPWIENAEKIDVIDPHYYETPGWFYRNAYVYDKLPANYPYKIYVGEYAAVGAPLNLHSSLGEAAYLTGVERNADKVRLVSYAPLIQHAEHGKNHLVILKNDSVYGRTNYHMLKMFANNRPDVNLATTVETVEKAPVFQPKGYIGVGTDGSSAEFKDFKVTQDGKQVYASQWQDFADKWTPKEGEWTVENDMLKQAKVGGNSRLLLKDSNYENCVIEMKARKTGGNTGFRVIFGGKDDKNYFMVDFGSHGNESVLFREINEEEGSVSLFDYRSTYDVLMNHWYDVRVEINGNDWKCYLDGKLAYEYTYLKEPRHYVVTGYDKQKNEVIIKLINSEATAWKPEINIANAKKIASKGEKIVITSASKDDENDFSAPEKVVPVSSEISGLGKNFEIECAPYSFTILRIPCEK